MRRNQINKILVFTYNRRASCPGSVKTDRDRWHHKGPEKPAIAPNLKMSGKSSGPIAGRVVHQSTGSRDNHGMVDPTTRKLQAGLNILKL